MSFINRLIKYCSFDADSSFPDRFYKSIFLNFFSVMLLTFSIIILISNLWIGNKTSIILSVGYSALSIIQFSHLRIKKNIVSSSIFFGILLLVLLILSFLIDGLRDNTILILSIYPVFMLLFNKRKNAVIFLYSGLVFLLAGVFIPENTLFYSTASFHVKLGTILMFVLLGIFTNMYEKMREKSLEGYTNLIDEAKGETKEKEDFISKLSHQIRTPLNNLVVVTNLVDTSAMDDKQKDLIDTIHASTNNLVNIVNNITELTSVEIQPSKIYNQNFNLEATIQSTLKLFANLEDLEFKINIDEGVDQNLFGDPVKLKQIFLNLLESIIKNSKSGNRKITLSLSQKNIDSENPDILFELSSNDLLHLPALDNLVSKSKNDSTKNNQIIKTLDLNIARKIIESLSGEYDINYTPNTFVFKVLLSFKKGEIVSGKVDDSLQIDISGDAETGLEKINLEDASVLLVEDNLINQKIVLLSLKKAVKHVDVANNGKEALDKFGSAKYDVILMDIQMPIMNGIVTTKKIRNLERSTNTHTPIIAITANALLGDKEECLAAGMDDYISKPFQIETLIQKMENQLTKI